MAHVGVERLGAGNREHDRAQSEKAEPFVDQEEIERVIRIERPQYVRVPGHARGAEHGQGSEIEHHHRAEQRAHLRCARALEKEQEDEKSDGDRHHKWF